MPRRGAGVPKKVTFAKFCMTKGGGGVQKKVNNDDKTWERGWGESLKLNIYGSMNIKETINFLLLLNVFFV